LVQEEEAQPKDRSRIHLPVNVVVDNQVFWFDDMNATGVRDLHLERFSKRVEVSCDGIYFDRRVRDDYRRPRHILFRRSMKERKAKWPRRA
jgi:hypothetical protein